MNRLTAILLTLLFLFNLIGYKAFFFYAQQKSDKQYEAVIDSENYDESKMITIKVDLDMPYLGNTIFERIDGAITVDGQIYKYVKRKIQNGQLVLLCLPDEQGTRLKSARQEFFTYANNLEVSQHSSAPKIQKAAPSDYDQFKPEFKVLKFTAFSQYDLPTDQRIHLSPLSDLPERPPQFM